MTELAVPPTPTDRRARKKAVTRRTIAEAAMGLFLAQGYDAVGIRDVANKADVAVTTLFSHFASKEALVFEQEHDFEQRLADAVSLREPDEPLVPALRREVDALVEHCTADGQARVWRMIDGTPALRDYAHLLTLRYAERLSAAIGSDPELAVSPQASRTIARFVVDAFSLTRESDDHQAMLDQSFRMIEAAWAATDHVAG